MKSVKGHLLVASPGLITPFFSRTVILMIEHSPEGAMGVVLNRATEATVRDVAEQVLDEPLDWDKPIGIGGPVNGPLLVVHAEEAASDQRIRAGLHSTVEAARVRDLLRRKVEPSVVVANYSGWGPGQLEGEMDEDSWLVWPATDDLVFADPDNLWEKVVALVRAAQLQEMTGVKDIPPDPSVN
jgi:putative transcriptional regulator